MEQYIWQNKSWPQFFWNPQSIIYPLAKVCKNQGLLEGQIKMLPKETWEDIIIKSITEEIADGCILAGSKIKINKIQLKSAVSSWLKSKTDQNSHIHVSHPLTDLFFTVMETDSHKITLDHLIGWNKQLTEAIEVNFNNINQEEKNNDFRKEEYTFIKNNKICYKAPSHNSLNKEMELFLKWFNKPNQTLKLNNILKSAISYIYFIAIHPFPATNNKIDNTLILAGLLSLKELIKDNTSANLWDSISGNSNIIFNISSQLLKNKEEYDFMLVRSLTTSMDITPWLLWYMDQINISILSLIKGLERTEEIQNIAPQFENLGINKRQEMILKHLFNNTKKTITSTIYSEICQCSQDTASRDLEKLLKMNLIKKGSSRGRSTFYYI